MSPITSDMVSFWIYYLYYSCINSLYYSLFQIVYGNQWSNLSAQDIQPSFARDIVFKNDPEVQSPAL